jgi:hypothetical protein
MRARAVFLGAMIAAALVALTVTSEAVAAPERGEALRGALSFAIDPLQEELAIDALAASSDPGTKHIGPVPSTSPDNGTCNNDWAEDTFDRYFTIRPTSDPAVFTVYEQFKNGSFVTNAGPSPGACEETDGSSPGVLAQGLTGTMHGYILTNVTCDPSLSACPDPSATCEAANACDTTNQFIATFFGSNAIRNDEAYFFHYAGYDGSNQALVYHEWKNASCNRGGDHGDIATAALLTPPFTTRVCI